MNIGIDIVSISRIKMIIDKWDNKFIDRIYTEREKRFCYDRKNFEECFAGRFAMKEAVFKALNDEKIKLKDIEFIDGKIYVKGVLKENIKVSISHEREFAVAVAIKLD